MIGVVMGDEDTARVASRICNDGFEMSAVFDRARIDDEHTFGSVDKIGVCAMVRHFSGIAGDDPSYPFDHILASRADWFRLIKKHAGFGQWRNPRIE